ncbi:hypothetical protein Emed_005738 [Eimeria media]
MPTVHVVAEELFERLGRPYSDEELDTLCFAFGVELDEVTEQDGEKIFKIDVPANRYDLLCVEGLGRALRVFTSSAPQETIPCLRLSGKPTLCVTVKPSVLFVRRRTLASIGTYDMQQLHAPFTYEALPPEQVVFQPLGCGALPAMSGGEILAHFSNHTQLKQYLPLLEGQPKLYVLRDSKSQVLSMPPLINSEFCKLTETSRDVFIDCTSVEARRGELVLTLVAAMFAEYCDEAFTIEPVKIVYEQTKKETVTPSLATREMSVDMDIVRRICGLKDLGAEEASRQLTRLMLSAKPDPQDTQNKLIVSVPPTRSDIMHACDVAEDVAIGIGFDRLPVVVAPKLASNPRSLLSQSLRTLLTSLGFTECLTFALCSAEENAEALNKPRHPPFAPTPNYDPLEHQWLGQPVLLSNAKTRELTETRAQLISGILKALANNVGRREMPLKFFEIGDVVLRDDRTETKSRNLLYCCAAFADEHGSGLEEVHGLLDATMEALGFVGDYAVAERQAALAAGKEEQKETLRSLERMSQFSLKPTNLPTFLPGRQVEILAHRQRNSSSSSSGHERSKGETAKETQSLRIGHMGTLHVDCLRAFGLALPGEEASASRSLFLRLSVHVLQETESQDQCSNLSLSKNLFLCRIDAVSVVEFTLEPFLEWLPETDLIFA